jgi:ParB family chromosome partitioning protein
MKKPFSKLFNLIDKSSEDKPDTESLQKLPLENIVPNRYQPRTVFNHERIRELADSILEHGLLQPITVRPIEENMYEIIAGERRFRAMKLLHMEETDALIRYLTDQETAAVALIENIQRENLSSIEEARAYRKLLEMEDITQKDLAQNLGKSQSFIANKLRLLKLSDSVIEALGTGEITERHARSLLSLEDEEQGEVLGDIRDKKLTVKETEDVVKKRSEKDIKQINFNNDVSFVVNDITAQVEKLKDKGHSLAYASTDEDGYVEVSIKVYK